MKKILTVFAALALTLTLASCNNDVPDNNSETIHVTSVEIAESAKNLELEVDETFTFGTRCVTVLPEDATNKSYTLSSSNTSVFTTSGYVITGVGEGSATLTVTTTDGGFSDTASVTVVGIGGDENPNPEPEPEPTPTPTTEQVVLTLLEDSYQLEEGGAGVPLQYTVEPEGATVVAQCVDPNVAYIDSEMNVVPVLSGETTINFTATYEGYEQATASASVIVTKAPDPDIVTSISFANESYTIEVGAEGKTFEYGVDVLIEGTGEYSKEFTLSVDAGNETYVTVSNNTVTAMAYTAEPITLYATPTGGEVVSSVEPATTSLTITLEPVVTDITFKEVSYTTTYIEGTGAEDIDLSNEVIVTGNETLTNTEFTISCEENDYISIENNVVKAHKPTPEEGITVTATAKADETKTAEATIFVKDETNYVSSVSLNAESYVVYYGNTDEEHTSSAEISATVTGVDSSKEAYNTEYDITVADPSLVTYNDGHLVAVTQADKQDHTTTVWATSIGLNSYGGQVVKSEEVTVQLKYLKTQVSNISFSTESYPVKEEENFTIGPDGSGANVIVSVSGDADDQGWTLKTDDTSLITLSDPEEGIYTVTAKMGGAEQKATITAVPDDPVDATVTATLTVSIIAYDSNVHYVDSITFDPETITTINEGDSFTIGDADKGADYGVVLTSGQGETPDDLLYKVELETSSDHIEITEPASEDSLVWTVKALPGAGGEVEGGQTYTLKVTADDGHHMTATINFTVDRPTPVASTWEVTLNGSSDLETTLESKDPGDASRNADSINLNESLSVSVEDQYGDAFDSSYTLALVSGNDCVEFDNGVVTAKDGVEGTAYVSVTADANKELLNTTITISVTKLTYVATSITINGEDSIDTTVDWGGSYDAVVEILPSYVTEQGYTVELTSGDSIFTESEDGDTITFQHNGENAGTATYTVASKDNVVSTTITLTVEEQEPEVDEGLLGKFDFSSHTSGTTAISSASALDAYWTGSNDVYTGVRQYASAQLGGDGSLDCNNYKECIKLGGNGSSGTLELKFALGTTISKVVVTAHSWTTSSADTLTVNDETQTCSTSGTATDLTYTISEGGTYPYLVTMVSSGRMIISGISIYGTYDPTNIVEPKTITLQAEESEITAGETTHVGISWTPTNAILDFDAVNWDINDESIATISVNASTNNVTIHAANAGDAVITATYGELTSSVTIQIASAADDPTLIGKLDFTTHVTASNTAFSQSTLQTALNTSYSGESSLVAGSDTAYCYPGSNGSGNGVKGNADCIQLASSSKIGYFTISFNDSNIEVGRISIVAAYYDSSTTLTVGETSFSVSENSTAHDDWEDFASVEHTASFGNSIYIASTTASSHRILLHSITFYSA